MSGLYELRLLLLGGFLAYASYQDYIRREIDDEVWLLCTSILLPMTLYDYLLLRSDLLLLSLFSIVTSALLSLLFYFGRLYGGADCKAIVTIALSAPLMESGGRTLPFLPLSTMINGLVATTVVPIGLLVYNVYRIVRGERLFDGFEGEGVGRKVLASLLGTRVRDHSKLKFWASMESPSNLSTRSFKFSMKIDDFGQALRGDMWATPGIPLLVFITIGYLIAVVWGDVFLIIVRLLGG
ncbi:MAG: hypothetical protein NZ920_03370 [Aigarchaeota archaeon]|nr:hypothetical protein [Aigarchaeota archaeon]MDW8092341.1 A24 family peptidase C-terminal domain-containing protein [Nitrososphaerota archaeon]